MICSKKGHDMININEKILKEISINCETIAEVSSKIGLSYSQTRNLLNKYELNNFKRGQRKKNPSEHSFKLSREDLFDMYISKDMSLRDIGSTIGVSYQAVHNWVKAYNIESKSKGRNKSESLFAYILHNRATEESDTSYDSEFGIVLFLSEETAKNNSSIGEEILMVDVSKLIKKYPESIFRKDTEDDNGDIQVKNLDKAEAFNIIKYNDGSYKKIYIKTLNNKIEDIFTKKL